RSTGRFTDGRGRPPPNFGDRSAQATPDDFKSKVHISGASGQPICPIQSIYRPSLFRIVVEKDDKQRSMTMNFSDWIMENGESLQVSVFFSLLMLLALAERVIPRRSGSMERRSRWPTNLLFTLLNFVALSVLPVSFITAAFWGAENGLGLLNVI